VLALVLTAAADPLDDLLAKGEVSLLQTRPDGRVKEATAIAYIPRPVEEVWSKLVNFGDYANWMPQVAQSNVVSQNGDVVVADWSVAVVGPNINFRESMTLDAANHTISGVWVSGALPGSHWDWRLVPKGSGTVVYRALYTNVVDSNWLVRQVEDENHTLEYGINVATGMVEIRSLKRALGVP
jgi:ribosome-associated toxin RatA of RatAB toxin-antitoxin module